MSMYCTGTLVLQRNAPAGMRCTSTITLLQWGEMRSGVCGQRGSGGKALSVAAPAMPTRSAPSSLARRFTLAASISDRRAFTGRILASRLTERVILSLKYLGCEALIFGHIRASDRRRGAGAQARL